MRLAVLFAALTFASAASAFAAEDDLSFDQKGLHVKALDGNVEMREYMVWQFDRREYLGNSITTTDDEFRTRRLRPYTDITLYHLINYRLMVDFAGPIDRIIDHYVEITPDTAFKLRGGKFKAPQGLEQLQNDEALLFAERGLTSNLMSFRDVGGMAYGSVANERVEYQLALLRGNMDGNQFDGNGDDNLDVAARVFLTPWKSSSDAWLSGLGIGIAGTEGQHDGTASRPLLPRYRTIGQQTAFSYSSGIIADGTGWRLIPQASYYKDSAGLTAEYAISSQEYTRGANHAALEHHAWQLLANYVLTGEKASYKSLDPAHPVDLTGHNFGAFELVARVGGLSFDQAAFPNFASAARSVHDITDYGIGINWYLTYNLRLGLDYDLNRFSGGATGGDRPDEQFLVFRTQLKF